MNSLGKIVFLFYVIISLSITGCNKEDDPVGPEGELPGTWILTKITTTTALGAVDLTPEQADFYMTLILRADGTYQATIINKSETTLDSGTWTAANGNITINHQNNTSETGAYTLTWNKFVVNTTIMGPTNEMVPVKLGFTKQ